MHDDDDGEINLGTIVGAACTTIVIMWSAAAAIEGDWKKAGFGAVIVAIICIVDRLRWPKKRPFWSAALFGEKEDDDE